MAWPTPTRTELWGPHYVHAEASSRRSPTPSGVSSLSLWWPGRKTPVGHAATAAATSRSSRCPSTTRGCATAGRSSSWARRRACGGRLRVQLVGPQVSALRLGRHHRRAAREHLGVRRYAAPMVLEGGAITVDGQGTLITTESCLLHPSRNPHLSQAEIEDTLKEYLGLKKVIWLKSGLGLEEDPDTDGHVDGVAAFVGPGRVLLTWSATATTRTLRTSPRTGGVSRPPMLSATSSRWSSSTCAAVPWCWARRPWWRTTSMPTWPTAPWSCPRRVPATTRPPSNACDRSSLTARWSACRRRCRLRRRRRPLHHAAGAQGHEVSSSRGAAHPPPRAAA